MIFTTTGDPAPRRRGPHRASTIRSPPRSRTCASTIPTAPERRLTFRQCLAHQTHLPGGRAALHLRPGPAARCAPSCCSASGRRGPPVYSDINFILLGIAHRAADRPRARRAARCRRASPSGPTRRCAAATERCTWRGRVMRGEVHDENAFALGGASGHAGLFGTIDGVLDFAPRPSRRHGASRPPASPAIRTPRNRRRARSAGRRSHPGWSGGDACSDDDDRPYRLHRHRPVDRFRARPRLDAADQPRPPDRAIARPASSHLRRRDGRARHTARSRASSAVAASRRDQPASAYRSDSPSWTIIGPHETIGTSGWPTEDRSARFDDLDSWPSLDVLAALYEGQLSAVAAVRPALPAIAAAAEDAVERLGAAGAWSMSAPAPRAASACRTAPNCRRPSTGRTSGSSIVMAGGEGALLQAVENAEDSHRRRRRAHPRRRRRPRRRRHRRRRERHDAVHGRGSGRGDDPRRADDRRLEQCRRADPRCLRRIRSWSRPARRSSPARRA